MSACGREINSNKQTFTLTRLCAYSSVFLPPRRFFRKRATTATTVIAMMITMRTATTPPMMAAVGSEDVSVSPVSEEHSPSLNDEMATAQSGSTVMSTLHNTGSTPHPVLYQRDEGATVSLRGTLQSGTICHIWLGVNDVTAWSLQESYIADNWFIISLVISFSFWSFSAPCTENETHKEIQHNNKY